MNKSFKLFLFALFLLSHSLNLRGQEMPYQPMVLEGAHWFLTGDNCSTIWYDWFYTYTLKGDTLVNDTLYKKTYRYDFVIDDDSKNPLYSYQIAHKNLVALLREDTLARQVWVKFVDNHVANYYHYDCPILGDHSQRLDTITPEILLYDFSLSTGDTIDWCYTKNIQYNEPYTDILKPLIVDSITTSYETHCFDGIGRREMNIFGFLTVPCGLQPAYEGSIVEGIGFSEDGLFYGADQFCGYCIGSDLECDIITSTHQVRESNYFSIYPNPSRDYIELETPSNLYQVRIEIYNLTGQLLKQGTALSPISIQDLPNGIYLAQLFAEDRPVEVQKLCVQR